MATPPSKRQTPPKKSMEIFLVDFWTRHVQLCVLESMRIPESDRRHVNRTFLFSDLILEQMFRLLLAQRNETAGAFPADVRNQYLSRHLPSLERRPLSMQLKDITWILQQSQQLPPPSDDVLAKLRALICAPYLVTRSSVGELKYDPERILDTRTGKPWVSNNNGIFPAVAASPTSRGILSMEKQPPPVLIISDEEELPTTFGPTEAL